MSITFKGNLHQLIDELDEAADDELHEYAHWLTPDENEPLTDRERARVEAGKAEIRRGDCVTLEDVKRRLGNC